VTLPAMDSISMTALCGASHSPVIYVSPSCPKTCPIESLGIVGSFRYSSNPATFRIRLQIRWSLQLFNEASFLASVSKAFTDCIKLFEGPSTCLSWEYHDGTLEATKRQLHIIAQKRQAREAGRASRVPGWV
jgi:hypothetical protein